MQNTPPLFQNDQTAHSCRGLCTSCDREHSLGSALARQYCLELMHTLDREKRVDLTVHAGKAERQFSTDYLFGEARGQMFGVMVYRQEGGSLSIIKAFSGQYDGIWEVEGWAPPLFDVHEFNTVNHDVEKQIKELTRQIDMLDASFPERIKKIAERKKLSQQLMLDIHSLYRLHNFRGQVRTLNDVFTGPGGIPTGTGDCCAPKLLNYAAKNGLKPLGIAEFYWGLENKSGTRQHGQFYPSCEGKCQPILGFMLCGLKTDP